MKKLVALNSQAHRDIKIDLGKINEAGADVNMLPVYVNEFLNVVVDYPILFSKDVQTGQFVCVALLGFEQGENLYWYQAKWDAVYIPMSVSRQPFYIGQKDDCEGTPQVCIDMNCSAVNTAQGEYLFDKHGQHTEYLKDAQATLASLLAGEKLNLKLIEALLEYELLIPLLLDIEFKNGKRKKVQGLYSIDEDKVAQLSAAQLNDLFSKELVQAIYTQLASVGQLYRLIDKQNWRDDQVSLWLTPAEQNRE